MRRGSALTGAPLGSAVGRWRPRAGAAIARRCCRSPFGEPQRRQARYRPTGLLVPSGVGVRGLAGIESQGFADVSAGRGSRRSVRPASKDVGGSRRRRVGQRAGKRSWAGGRHPYGWPVPVARVERLSGSRFRRHARRLRYRRILAPFLRARRGVPGSSCRSFSAQTRRLPTARLFGVGFRLCGRGPLGECGFHIAWLLRVAWVPVFDPAQDVGSLKSYARRLQTAARHASGESSFLESEMPPSADKPNDVDAKFGHCATRIGCGLARMTFPP